MSRTGLEQTIAANKAKYDALKVKYGSEFSESKRADEDIDLIDNDSNDYFVHLVVTDTTLSEEQVKQILQNYLKGANLSTIMQQNKSKENALQLAIKAGRYDVADFILSQLSKERFEEGIISKEINHEDKYGHGALWYVVYSVQTLDVDVDVATIEKAKNLGKKLLENGAVFNAPDFKGFSEEGQEESKALVLVRMAISRAATKYNERNTLNLALSAIDTMEEDASISPQEEALRKEEEKARKVEKDYNSLLSSSLVTEFDSMIQLAEQMNGGKKIVSESICASLAKLPTFSKLLESPAGEKIARRFSAYYSTLEKTGVTSIDAARRNEEYLRFITREIAALTESKVANTLIVGGGISIDELVDVYQNILKDTGTNITAMVGIIGKRPPSKIGLAQYGAGSGGLGDKVTHEAFDAYIREYNRTQREDLKLREALLRNDNVELRDGEIVFLDSDKPEEKKKIEAYGLTRETVEEFLELAIASYVEQNFKTPLRDIIKGILGGAELSTKAIEIIDRQEQSVRDAVAETLAKYAKENPDAELAKKYAGKSSAEVAQLFQKADLEKVFDEKRDVVNEQTAKVEKDVKVYRKFYREDLYKKKIEPHFALFLKETEEGKALFEDVRKSISGADAIAVVANDLSYPRSTVMGAGSNIAKGNPDVYGKIAAPRSTSYFVIPEKGSALDKLVKGATDLESKKMKVLKPFVVECRGFEFEANPLTHLVRLLEIYSSYKDNEGFSYPHEGAVQIKATVQFLKASGISEEDIFKAIKAKFTDYAKFEAGLLKQLDELVKFKLEDVKNPGEVLRTPSQVAHALFGGDLAKAVLTGLKKVTFALEVEPEIAGASQKTLKQAYLDISDKVKKAKAAGKKVSEAVSDVELMTLYGDPGESVMHYLVREYRDEAARKVFTAVIEGRGVNVRNVKNTKGESPIHIAAELLSANSVTNLVNKGWPESLVGDALWSAQAEVTNVPDNDGKSALFRMVKAHQKIRGNYPGVLNIYTELAITPDFEVTKDVIDMLGINDEVEINGSDAWSALKRFAKSNYEIRNPGALKAARTREEEAVVERRDGLELVTADTDIEDKKADETKEVRKLGRKDPFQKAMKAAPKPLEASHDFAKNIEQAIKDSERKSTEGYGYPRIRKPYFAKAPYLTYEGCTNFRQYIAYLKSADTDSSVVKSQLVDVFGCKKSLEDLEEKLTARFPAFRERGAMTDPKFFHYFLLSLGELEAKEQLERDVKGKDADQAFVASVAKMELPQSTSVDAFLGSDASVKSPTLRVDGATTQGRRKSGQDSFLAGDAKVKGDQVFPELDKRFKKLEASLRGVDGGTTAAICHIEGDQIKIANCGDSRAVLYVWDILEEKVKAIRLTADHRVDDPIEMDRIKSLGGVVDKEGRVVGRLNMPRSLGDSDIQSDSENSLISNRPDFYHYNLKSLGINLKVGDQAHLCVSCDGVFDNGLNEKEYIAALNRWFLDAGLRLEFKGNMSEFLLDCATGAGKSADNVSVVTCDLTKTQAAPRIIGVFDGHGTKGRDVSSKVAQEFAGLTKEKSRLMHCASDFKPIGYKATAALLPQILKKYKPKTKPQPYEILGVKEKATPREIVNSYWRMLELVNQQPGAKKAKEDARKIISQAFIEQLVESCKTSSSAAISCNEYSHKSRDASLAYGPFAEAQGYCDVLLFKRASLVIKMAQDLTEPARAEELKILNPKTKEAERAKAIVEYVKLGGDPRKFVSTTPFISYVVNHGTPSDLNRFLINNLERSEKERCEIDERNGANYTALQIATGSVSHDKVLLLLRNGANPNAKVMVSGVEKTPLQLIDDLSSNNGKKTALYLLQYGAELSAEMAEKIPPEVLQKMNSYDEVDLALEDAATIPTLGSQIVARSKEVGTYSSHRILGLWDGEATIESKKVVPANVPWRVLGAFNDLFTKLGDADPSLAKPILAGAFLVQFNKVCSNGANKDRQELFSEKNPASTLVAQYSHLLSTIQKVESNLLGYGSAAKARELGMAYKNSAEAFKEKLKETKIETTAEFEAVLAAIEESKTQGFSKDHCDVLYQILTQIVPGENCKISAENFAYLISEIPQTDAYKAARQDLSRAFIAQFKGKDSNEICRAGLLEGVSSEQLQSIRNLISLGSDFAHDLGAKSLANFDRAIVLKSILVSLENSSEDDKKLKLLTEFFNYGGKIDLLPESLMQHPTVIAQRSLEEIASRIEKLAPETPTQLTSTESSHLQEKLEKVKGLESGKDRKALRQFEGEEKDLAAENKNRLRSHPGKITALEIMGLSSQQPVLKEVMETYTKEMDKVEEFEKQGANKAEVKKIKESLSAALITLMVGFDIKVANYPSDFPVKNYQLRDPSLEERKVLDKAKAMLEGKVTVLGAVKLSDQRLQSDFRSV